MDFTNYRIDGSEFTKDQVGFESLARNLNYTSILNTVHSSKTATVDSSETTTNVIAVFSGFAVLVGLFFLFVKIYLTILRRRRLKRLQHLYETE